MAVVNFPRALSLTLQYEGGFSNNPRDPGGATNLGVTIATLSHERSHPASIADVKALTFADVEPIYRKKYWNLIGGDDLPSGVDILAFDIAVNSGPGRAMQWLAASVNMPPANRLAYLDNRRRSFWKSLRTFITFGRGWMNRENAVYIIAKHAL